MPRRRDLRALATCALVALSLGSAGCREAAGKLGAAEGVEGVLALLADADVSLRRDCVDALGDIAADEAVDPLALLARTAPDPATRQAAVEALLRSRADGAPAALQRLRKSGPPDVRRWAELRR